MRPPAIACAAAVALASIGCTGTITDPGGGQVIESCNDPRPAAAPLRRLTPIEYQNSVAVLFPEVPLPVVELTPDSIVDGFDNNAEGQVVSPLLIEQYNAAARAIAEVASGDRRWWPCDPVSDEAACGRTIVAALLPAAYRRPMTADERDAFEAFFETQRADFGFDTAVRMTIEVLLESPKFLYRPEVGDPDLPAPDGLVALDGYELASRLSYLLWRMPPDDELMSAAASGALTDVAELQGHALRMLADPRARDTIADFHRQWLALDDIELANLSPEEFPELTPSARQSLRASAQEFVDWAFWDAGSLQTLLTSRRMYVDDELASLLGLPPPGSDELTAIEADETRRAGILTQPGVLTATSHGITHSPILRGVFVLDAMLCNRPPPPPPEVMPVIPDPIEGDPRTTRERIEQTHGTEECAVCHRAIDGIGFLFENYDAVGRYRTTEFGFDVDATGELYNTDVDGFVDGAVDLAHRLADSVDVQRCVVKHYLRYSLGRSEQRDDDCQITDLTGMLQRSGGNMRQLLIDIVTSPSFRYLPAQG